MKRLVFMLIAVSMASLAGPQANAGEISIGFKGGLNVVDITGKDAGEYHELKPEFAAGVFITFALTGRLSIQPEFYYMRKGTMEYDRILTMETNLDYIDLLLLVKYDFPLNGRFSPSLFAGPYLGILTGAKFTYDVPGDSGEFDIADRHKSLDLGLVLGACLDIAAGPGSVILDLRFARGLTTIANMTEDALEYWGYDEQPGVYNKCIMVMAGYGFAF